MSIIFVLIPLGLGLLAIALWAFLWAVNNEQFDDLDRAAHRILFDDEPGPGSTVTSASEAGDEPAPDDGLEGRRD